MAMATAIAAPHLQPIVAPYPKSLCSVANSILSSGFISELAKRL
jgi:hypothetical protein